MYFSDVSSNVYVYIFLLLHRIYHYIVKVIYIYKVSVKVLIITLIVFNRF